MRARGSGDSQNHPADAVLLAQSSPTSARRTRVRRVRSRRHRSPWCAARHAYADSFDEKEGRYRGLRCGQMVTIAASEATGLLVKPDVAAKQQEAERPP